MQLRVMSFNIRFDKPDPGEFNWRVRRNAIAALIKHYAPDIFGTQEGKAHQLLDLHRLLPDYQSVGGDRVGDQLNEHCAIFYKSEQLRCQDSGDFFLSDTPEVPGSITPEWGNPVPRMASWAIFSLPASTRPVYIINTHFDYHSAKAQELSAKLIRDRLNALNTSAFTFFITGDFNASPDSLPRQLLSQPLANGVQLQDILAGLKLDRQMSYHEFTGKGFDAVDTIYYDPRIRLETVTVDKQKWLEVLPSDHFPIIGTFGLVQ